ncbi:hypothetical protein NE237_020345 [Protea cynaroides]|uniref:Uncharacterized protein n=1 Tax=Protea cynaroides TaxID=273540 RepID=A0A9Q0H725_9MAGN|nr:hypothetical protein NE237_020345 [Protea cynaroides]
MINVKGSVYGASKAALINFYDSLRVELASEVSVTIISSGLVESEMSQGKALTMQGAIEVDPEFRKRMQGIPADSTEDCVKAVVAAVCRGDKYITEPWWYNAFYLLKILCPEVIEWGFRSDAHLQAGMIIGCDRPQLWVRSQNRERCHKPSV